MACYDGPHRDHDRAGKVLGQRGHTAAFTTPTQFNLQPNNFFAPASGREPCGIIKPPRGISPKVATQT